MLKAESVRKTIAASLALSISLLLCVEPKVGASTTNQATRSTQTSEKTNDKRKEIVSEAVSSLRETQDALKALDEGKTKEALANLERATGKLDIVLARDPKVSLIPIDVRVSSVSIVGSLDEIKSARLNAQKLLMDGQVQKARAILATLASETIISTTNIPVVSYPAALKNAAKLIDQNKSAQAKEILQTALNTLVVTDVVIPLPVVDAQISLAKASELAKAKERTATQNKQLTELLNAADNDVKVAEALGYGRRADFDLFHRQIEEIRQKTSNGKSGVGIFDQIKTYVDSMTKNSQHKAQDNK